MSYSGVLKGGGIAVVVVLFLGMFYIGYKAIAPIAGLESATQKLLQEGIETPGQVVSIAATNQFVNNQPVADLKVSYSAAGQTQIAEFEQVVPMVYLPQIQPGKAVILRVDKTDPHKAVVDLLKLGSAPVASSVAQ